MTGPADLCPHGDIRAACLECLHDPPAVPSKPRAEGTMVARFDSHCAADYRHDIDTGDTIGDVPDVGWCCRQCFVR